MSRGTLSPRFETSLRLLTRGGPGSLERLCPWKTFLETFSTPDSVTIVSISLVIRMSFVSLPLNRFLIFIINDDFQFKKITITKSVLNNFYISYASGIISMQFLYSLIIFFSYSNYVYLDISISSFSFYILQGDRRYWLDLQITKKCEK